MFFDDCDSPKALYEAIKKFLDATTRNVPPPGYPDEIYREAFQKALDLRSQDSTLQTLPKKIESEPLHSLQTIAEWCIDTQSGSKDAGRELKVKVEKGPPKEEVMSGSKDKRIKVTEAAELLGDDRDTVSRRATEGKKDMREFSEIVDRLIAQSKDLIAKKQKDLIIPPVPPEVKETFSKTSCNLLMNLPFRCYEIVINAHKNKLSSSQKSILVHTFEEEQHIARRLVAELPKVCVGSDPEYRLDFFREFEKWFEHLEHVFKKFLFQQSSFKSDLEFIRFDIMLNSQFLEFAKSLLNLLNRFSVMSCVTGEKWEYAAKAMVNIGAIPQSTLESIEETQAQLEELDKSKKMLEDAADILSEKIKRFKDSQKQEIEPAETGQKEIVEVKPGAFGITVNIKEIAKRIWMRVFSHSKD